MKNSQSFTVPGSDREYSRTKMLAVLLIPLAMALLQISSVDNILPAIQNALDASGSDIQWVLSGYALAVGIALVPSGRLGDVFGRSGMFVAGLVVFTLGSLACGLSTNPEMLNTMRILQGIGAGMFSPQVNGLIQQYFEGRARAKAFGLMGLVIGASVAAGPILSGLFVSWLGESAGWRWSFIINAPIGVVGIIVAFFYLPFGKERRTIGRKAAQNAAEYNREQEEMGKPATRKRGTKLDLDPFGMVMLCASVLCIMLPFMTTGSWRWLLLAAGIVLGVLWVLWERSYKRRGRIPMVNLGLFSLESFSFSVGVSALQFLGTTSIFVILALFLQNGMGASALEVGMVGLPSAIASAFAAVWAGRHSLEKGRELQVLALGLIVLASLGLIGTSWHISQGASIWWFSLSLTVLGFGFGCMGSANQTTAMLDVPAAHGGTAGGVYQTTQRITTAIGIALITAVFFAGSGSSSHTESVTSAQWYSSFSTAMIVVVIIVLAALVTAWIAMIRARKQNVLSK